MSALTEAREALKALELPEPFTGRFEETVPERVAPPVFILTPGSPFLEPGDTFGTMRARWEITAVSQTASSAVQTAELDAMIEELLVVLHNAPRGYRFLSASKPALLPANGATYLSSIILITEPIDI